MLGRLYPLKDLLLTKSVARTLRLTRGLGMHQPSPIALGGGARQSQGVSIGLLSARPQNAICKKLRNSNRVRRGTEQSKVFRETCFRRRGGRLWKAPFRAGRPPVWYMGHGLHHIVNNIGIRLTQRFTAVILCIPYVHYIRRASFLRICHAECQPVDTCITLYGQKGRQSWST